MDAGWLPSRRGSCRFPRARGVDSRAILAGPPERSRVQHGGLCGYTRAMISARWKRLPPTRTNRAATPHKTPPSATIHQTLR